MKNSLEKILAEWKEVVGHLEELAKKIKYQEDINTYFREMGELEKSLNEKEVWLKDVTSSASQQQPLAALKESCQVSMANLFILILDLWKGRIPEYHCLCQQFKLLHDLDT